MCWDTLLRMRKNVLIIEDNKACMDALAKITRECDSASAVFCADNVEKAYKIAMETRIDLFLVDIILEKTPGDVSGMFFVNHIREVKRYQFIPIIFVTSLENYRMSAYDNLHCYRYIEKPFDIKQVKETILSALEFPSACENINRFFHYRKDGIVYTLDTNSLIYASYYYRNMQIYMEQETVNVPYLTCKKMLKDLNDAYFMRCSRNTIVNKKYIDYVDQANRYIGMANGKILEIGSELKKSFLREFRYGH